MTAKPSLAFQPAPRPQPRTSPEDTKALQEATKDLGFGRATSSPSPAIAVEPRPASPSKRPDEPSKTPPRRRRPEVQQPEATKHGPSLKFSVPDEVWNELRLQALQRRVTVRFLVLEALAAKGYDVDLEAIPEDGRRIR